MEARIGQGAAELLRRGIEQARTAIGATIELGSQPFELIEGAPFMIEFDGFAKQLGQAPAYQQQGDAGDQAGCQQSRRALSER
jgi:hypothetical protein